MRSRRKSSTRFPQWTTLFATLHNKLDHFHNKKNSFHLKNGLAFWYVRRENVLLKLIKERNDNNNRKWGTTSRGLFRRLRFLFRRLRELVVQPGRRLRRRADDQVSTECATYRVQQGFWLDESSDYCRPTFHPFWGSNKNWLKPKINNQIKLCLST